MVAYLLTTPSRCGIFYGNTPPAIGGVIPFLIPLIFKSHKFEKSKMAKSLFYSFLTVFHFKKSTLRLPMHDMAFTKVAQQAITERRSDV